MFVSWVGKLTIFVFFVYIRSLQGLPNQPMCLLGLFPPTSQYIPSLYCWRVRFAGAGWRWAGRQGPCWLAAWRTWPGLATDSWRSRGLFLLEGSPGCALAPSLSQRVETAPGPTHLCCTCPTGIQTQNVNNVKQQNNVIEIFEFLKSLGAKGCAKDLSKAQIENTFTFEL